jgi:hypothetical protein
VDAPYRIAAPPEPEGPDPVDAYEALLRARALRSRRIVTCICGGLAAVSITALAESPPARHLEEAAARESAGVAGAQRVIAGARAHVESAQLAFAAGIAAAVEADGAHPERPSNELESSPCPITLPEASRLVHGKQAFPLLVVPRGDRDLPSPSASSLLADVQRAEAHLANGRPAEAVMYANALSAQGAPRLRYDIVLVTSFVKHPVRTSSTSFEPGEVMGRAYLYDFSQRRVTCAGDVHASSSRHIQYSFVPAAVAPAAMDQGPRLTSSLDEDLEVQLQRAIAHALVAR